MEAAKQYDITRKIPTKEDILYKDTSWDNQVLLAWETLRWANEVTD